MRGKIEFKKFQKEKKKIDYIIFQYQKIQRLIPIRYLRKKFINWLIAK